MAELDDKELQRYENLLLKAQQYKIPEREMTIFDTALKNHHENPITELLSFFLNPNEKHGLGTSFYDGFINSLNDKEEYEDFDFGSFLKVSTQQKTDKGNFIDLWVETDTALIIVEVKVYHYQKNPFQDYLAWGRKKLKEFSNLTKKEESYFEKELVPLILCPDGISYAEQWLGLAYNDLTLEIRTALAHEFFKISINKWGIFARDFLLHLDSFVDLLETNMESINFVVQNMKKIQELVELRDSAYQEIIDYINNEIKNNLGEDFEPIVKWHTWAENHPAIRFSGSNWKDKWTDTTLNLHITKNPMSCSVHIHIENQNDELIKKLKQYLRKVKFQASEPWYERNKKFWCMKWDFDEFNLEEISQFLVFTQVGLNKVETEWKIKTEC